MRKYWKMPISIVWFPSSNRVLSMVNIYEEYQGYVTLHQLTLVRKYNNKDLTSSYLITKICSKSKYVGFFYVFIQGPSLEKNHIKVINSALFSKDFTEKTPRKSIVYKQSYHTLRTTSKHELVIQVTKL